GPLPDRLAEDVGFRPVHGLDVLDLAVVVGDLELDLVGPADDAEVGPRARLLDPDLVGLLRLGRGGPEQQRQRRRSPTPPRHDSLRVPCLGPPTCPPLRSPAQGRGEVGRSRHTSRAALTLAQRSPSASEPTPTRLSGAYVAVLPRPNASPLVRPCSWNSAS